MQSTFDRDEFVTINWDNIMPFEKHNFQKFESASVAHFGTDYDFDSIMHYPKDAFSKNGKPTMMPRVKFWGKMRNMGQRIGMSPTDITKLNEMYECRL